MGDAADMFVDALNAIRDIRDKAKELGQAPPDSFERADPLMTDKARELEEGAGRVRDALPGLHDSLEKALESGRAARAIFQGSHTAPTLRLASMPIERISSEPLSSWPHQAPTNGATAPPSGRFGLPAPGLARGRKPSRDAQNQSRRARRARARLRALGAQR
jgi:hypothetical protein